MNKKIYLVITIIGGWFGLHHFVNGNRRKGFLYLFTLGLFYIGWFIDIYRAFKELKKYDNNSNLKTKNKFFVSADNITQDIIDKKLEVNDYVVFDFETTGTDTFSDAITEFTFLKYKNNKFIDELSFLVNPNTPIPRKVSEFTGITNEMVSNEHTIDYYIKDILNFIDGFVLIGHNICNFDYYFLKHAIERNIILEKNINYECIDTLIMARQLINDTENFKLETLKKYLNIKLISHRSKEDCQVTAKLYQYMIKNKL